MAMDVPIEEEFVQEVAEVSDHELEPDVMKKARALKMEWYRKMNVYENRPVEK